MGETRGSVGERSQSQGAAHARGESVRGHSATQWNFESVTKLPLCPVQVLRERQQQLKLRMQKNHEAQVESLKEREELIQRLELEREARRHKREQEDQRVASRMQEVSAQVHAASRAAEEPGPLSQLQQPGTTLWRTC